MYSDSEEDRELEQLRKDALATLSKMKKLPFKAAPAADSKEKLGSTSESEDPTVQQSMKTSLRGASLTTSILPNRQVEASRRDSSSASGYKGACPAVNSDSQVERDTSADVQALSESEPSVVVKGGEDALESKGEEQDSERLLSLAGLAIASTNSPSPQSQLGPRQTLTRSAQPPRDMSSPTASPSAAVGMSGGGRPRSKLSRSVSGSPRGPSPVRQHTSSVKVRPFSV